MDKEFIKQWKAYDKYRHENHVAALQEWSKQRETEKEVRSQFSSQGLLGQAIAYKSSQPPRMEEPTFANFMNFLVAQEGDRG